ncbi:MAG: sensor histidine kinase [Bradymonadales bacterium]|nr:MAG: sensor histidine kinase [Bradymonadales bacterium]
MFPSLRFKIVLSFSLVVVFLSLGLSFYFGKRQIEDRERYLFDLLSSQIQLQAAELKAVGDQFLNDDAALEASSYSILQADGRVWNQPPVEIEQFEPLPPSGFLLKPCLSLQGEEFLCGASYIPSLGVWLLEATPKENFTSVIKSEFFRVGLVTLFALILSVGFGLMLSLRLLSPLKALTKAARDISQAEWSSIKLPSSRSDEIGLLSQTFEQMISSLQARERELARSAQELAHSERLASLGRFGASIAHEVRNPLSSILGYTRQLEKTDLSDEQRASLQVVRDEGERCLEILSQMLRFARQESLSPRPFLVHEVLESSLLLLKTTAREKQIHIEKRMDSQPLVMGLPQQFQQVIMNLVLNAIQASPTGSQILISLDSTETLGLVRVEDRAGGIAPEILSKIFEPFFSTKTSEQGSGLGLSVSKEIVEKMGGQIQCHSEIGSGSVFELRLPLAKP